jgi:hypothetical protein
MDRAPSPTLLRAAQAARQSRVSAPSPAAIEELDVAVAAQIELQICVNDPALIRESKIPLQE